MIQTYFTEEMKIYRKTRTKTGGVVKESKTLVDTKRGAYDKATSQYQYAYGKENFNLSAVAFMPADADVQEDDILEYSGVDYDVISVINPMLRNNHIEVLLSRRD
jgi:hypothetical protein